MKQKLILSITLLCCLPIQCDEAKDKATVVAIQTKNAAIPVGPYSQAIKVTNASETLFISGQLPNIPETGELVVEPAEATRQCMMNLAAILKEANMDFTNVVETTILLKNMADFDAVNKVYASFFKEPYPARLTFQAGKLPKDATVEIRMKAVK